MTIIGQNTIPATDTIDSLTYKHRNLGRLLGMIVMQFWVLERKIRIISRVEKTQ